MPELVPEMAVLCVACKDPAAIATADVAALVISKGGAFNSEKQTQHAVAHITLLGSKGGLAYLERIPELGSAIAYLRPNLVRYRHRS